MQNTIEKPAQLKVSWVNNEDGNFIDINMIEQDSSGPWKFEPADGSNKSIPHFTNEESSYFFFISWEEWEKVDKFKLLMIEIQGCGKTEIVIQQIYEGGEKLVKAIEDYFNKQFIEWQSIRDS